ncbi:MAG: hypothetical protein SFY32_16995 [Bacteroidota bacterium]|nr:hypothetical protein [Bacteroidota bacterium]
MLLILLFSCVKDPGFPLEPRISFKSIQFIKGSGGNQDIIRLSIGFTDGDGDLGLSGADTTGDFNPKQVNGFPTNDNYYNMNLTFLFKNEKNEFVTCKDFVECPVPDSLLKLYNGRFPPLIPSGQKRPISGTLTYDVSSTSFYTAFLNQTIKFRLFIKDRSLNKSNVIETDTIRIK